MAPNQTYHMTCHCGREFICGDAIERECRVCRTLDHAPSCPCIDCRVIRVTGNVEKRLADKFGWPTRRPGNWEE